MKKILWKLLEMVDNNWGYVENDKGVKEVIY